LPFSPGGQSDAVRPGGRGEGGQAFKTGFGHLSDWEKGYGSCSYQIQRTPTAVQRTEFPQQFDFANQLPLFDFSGFDYPDEIRQVGRKNQAEHSQMLFVLPVGLVEVDKAMAFAPE
jgi:hypothetical protein